MMKKLYRLLIAEAVVVAVLAATLAALLLNPPGGEETYVFSDRSVSDLVSVLVENAGGYVSVSSRDGGYVLDGVPSELVDTEQFIRFLVSCSEVRALGRVERGQSDPEPYGLAAPQAKMTASFAGGETLTVCLGNQEPVSGDYYCAVEGKEGIYLLSAGTAQYYLIAKESLISFYVTPKLTVSSPLSALGDVTFSGGPLENPVTIESVSAGDDEVKMLARSFGAATHIVRGAGVYELDQTYGLTVLSPLCGMTGQSILSYGLTSEQEDAMGFAEPYMQAEFDYNSGSGEAAHYVLRFLPAAEDGSFFYVNAAGSGVVYLVERMPFFDMEYDKLLLRWFASPLLMDVTGVTVEDGGRRYEFAVDNTNPRNPAVTLDGEPLDVALFRNLFRLLGSAAADGDYLGPQPVPDGTAEMTLIYHYSEGKPDDVIALYPGNTRRVLVYVNGVCEFAMRDAFVARVREALTAVCAGEAFDIGW